MTDQEDEELKHMLMAERQVEAFLRIMATRYGLKEEDIPDLLDNMKWVAKHRATIDGGSTYALLALLGIIVAALAAAVWEGFKHFITGAAK